MKKDKLSKVLTCLVLMALGILIAIFGTGAIDVYLGIVACVSGTAILIDTIFLISRKEKMVATPFILAFVLLTIGVTLFTHYISFAALVNFLVVIVLGTGVALICYGLYLAANKQPQSGLLNMVMGVVSLVLSILYIAVPEFRKLFWIIAGVVIAVYGLLGLVLTLTEKK